jgi:hypothetical protein
MKWLDSGTGNFRRASLFNGKHHTHNCHMKPITVALLTMVTFWLGCTTPPRGSAFGREAELRKQISESVPMKEYGYAIKEMRFSRDYKKVLIVFSHPSHQEAQDNSQRRPNWEFILTEDDFGRYRGTSMQPFYTPGTASTPGIYITAAVPPR